MPSHLVSGTRLPERTTRVVVTLKPVTHWLFERPHRGNATPNRITFQLQPQENIELGLMSSLAGPEWGALELHPLELELSVPTGLHRRIAYERLFLDAFNGNHTLFVRDDEVRAAWAWIGSVAHAWKAAKLPRSFWGWEEIIAMNQTGYWPYTPSTNLLYGLSEALDMILEEGLDNVFARHQRLGEACRRAVRAWGLEIQCADPAVYSPVLTGVMMPEGIDADTVRRTIYDRFDMSLGAGLGKVKGRMFRIGHLGDCNDLTLTGALTGCEMGLKISGVPIASSGVAAAMDYLAAHAPAVALRAAA